MALEAFYRRHVDEISRFVACRVDDPHMAADLVAEVFLAAMDSAHTYRSDRGTELGWLYGVARNTLSAGRRRAVQEKKLESRIAGRRLLDPDDLSRIDDQIDAERQARHAIEAMEGLPESERAVLELVAIEQLSVAEAAAALGIKQGTARVRLHRARQALRRAPGLISATAVEGCR
ncbi:RNA polymerase sigma factor [Actinomadura barringtoniae]|uniref:RNA polymerase sigma factor n=1 Tax=Actinomadura barringtoniae TaxID=1427535 RepID=UPI0027DE1F05|nr:RNA polymerase sigma factor [Actinomadura barringtoniae]